MLTGSLKHMLRKQVEIQFIAILFLSIALGGCTSVTHRTYSKPLAYVKFAAQEACLTAGCELVPPPTTDASLQIKSSRSIRPGFLVGQGGETIEIDLIDRGNATDATIISHKHFMGFFAQRHADDRVADFLDQYIAEDAKFESMIAEPSAGVKP
jgi:hypothetical protein